jgi:transcriptional regulator with XRE-family HTH domain
MLRVKEIAKERGLSVKEIAKRLGVTSPALSQNIAGRASIDRLQKIADILEVSIPELFEKKKEVSVWIEYNGEKRVLTEKDLIRLFD